MQIDVLSSSRDQDRESLEAGIDVWIAYLVHTSIFQGDSGKVLLDGRRTEFIHRLALPGLFAKSQDAEGCCWCEGLLDCDGWCGFCFIDPERELVGTDPSSTEVTDVQQFLACRIP
jgi:hypothetical protein